MNTIGAIGELGARKFGVRGPGWRWRLSNWMRPSFILGLLFTLLALAVSKLSGIPTITSKLRAKVKRGGEWTDYGVVSRRVVTTAGVTYLCANWQGGAQDIKLFNFHGCGTGVTAEAIGDTTLVTESTTALNPDSTRATGTKTNPAGNQLQTVGTLTFDASAAVTEHGIFTQAATGGGTLWDRSLFSAINVSNGDSIQFTYVVTFNSGG